MFWVTEGGIKENGIDQRAIENVIIFDGGLRIPKILSIGGFKIPIQYQYQYFKKVQYIGDSGTYRNTGSSLVSIIVQSPSSITIHK